LPPLPSELVVFLILSFGALGIYLTWAYRRAASQYGQARQILDRNNEIQERSEEILARWEALVTRLERLIDQLERRV
jgi:hypothetical protein